MNPASLIKHGALRIDSSGDTLHDALTVERDGRVVVGGDSEGGDATLVLGSTVLHARSTATTPAASPAPSRPGTAQGPRRDATSVPVFAGAANQKGRVPTTSAVVDHPSSAADVFRARGVLEQHVVASAQRVKATRDRLRDRHDMAARRTPQPGDVEEDAPPPPQQQQQQPLPPRPASPTAHILEKTQTDHIAQRIAQRRAATRLVSTAAIIERRTGGKKNRSYEATEHSASGGLDPRRSLAMDRKAQASLPTAQHQRGAAAGAFTNALGLPVVISTSASAAAAAVTTTRVGSK
jgi:hypothetical protein